MAQPVSIEVRDVCKRFYIPALRSARSDRSRFRAPLSARRGRYLDVLRDISFDVHEGEFFGIVGRNGSGKSTLLKMLASVYRVDSGSIRIAGRLAPFLELGVGFNPQLGAYENVLLNGVMMGLTADQAKSRYEEIIDFAGLSDHTDLQLKNYSSGMKVRLGFSVMTHVDADVMLIDEVLAVGDAEFQQKCETVFKGMRDEGRTMVLVTHSMETVSALCDRALLLNDGEVAALGDPFEVSNRYLEVNMLGPAAAVGGQVGEWAERFAGVLADPPVRIAEAWLVDPEGRRTKELRTGEPIDLHALIEIEREVRDPTFKFRLDDKTGTVMFSGGSEAAAVEGGRALPGERLRVRATIENRLGAGRYLLSCAVGQRTDTDPAEPATRVTAISFEVEGEPGGGLLALREHVTFAREPRGEIAVR